MRDQEIIGLWEAYQQVHAQPEEVESVDEGVRPGEVETPLDKKKYRERRKSLAGREASADARSRGHEEPSTGRTYSTDEARSRRRGIHTPEKKPSRDAARDAAGGETGHGGPLKRKKVRKAKAMGELGDAPEKVKESVDLFDYLLEYLVAEGYADTNKAALVIMANMSEEWKQSIVEAINPGTYNLNLSFGRPSNRGGGNSMSSGNSGDPLGKIPKLKAEIEIANLQRQRNQQRARDALRPGSYGVPSLAKHSEQQLEYGHSDAGLPIAQSKQILAQNRRDAEAAAGLKPGSTEKDAWYNDPNYGKNLDGKMKFFSPRTVLAKQRGVEGKLTVDPNTGKKTFTAGAFTDAEKARYTSKGGK